ncbi:hypothetical protein P7C70_g3778, partial [Phenoliferia sp. Uapishka_3]
MLDHPQPIPIKFQLSDDTEETELALASPDIDSASDAGSTYPHLSRGFSNRSPHHQPRRRPTLLKRLKSIGHKAKESLTTGALSPTTTTSHSPAFRRPSTTSRTGAHGRVPPVGEVEEDEQLSTLERKSLKVRLVSFNMHDSLPSGDLTEFLGEVKSWRRKRDTGTSFSTHRSSLGGRSSVSDNSTTTSDSIISIPSPETLPQFPLTKDHPYHIIVIALLLFFTSQGQECPTASGITAGKLRALDGFGWTSVLESWLCGGPEKDESSDDSDSDDGGEEGEDTAGEHDADKGERNGGGEAASMKSKGSKATTSGGDTAIDGTGVGPYVLVEKERLLGIYLAVFVAKSCEGFIGGKTLSFQLRSGCRFIDCQLVLAGTSKNRVTAGLIGGRLGNKGGCGISLSFAGSRVLFISAHLAAHASQLDNRVANVKKIFEELQVDDFSGKDQSALPLTERFDQCFFMGDLNMRLNLSRLHADWLAKAHDWHIAMEFDQLGIVLADPKGCLQGFSEAPINFAPTYKYDVIPKIKKKRSTILRASRTIKRSSKDSNSPRSPDPHSSPLPPFPSSPQPAFISSPQPTLSSSPRNHPSFFSSIPQPAFSSSPHSHSQGFLSPRRDSDARSTMSSSASMCSNMSDYDRIDKKELPINNVNNLLPALNLPDSTAEAVRRAQVRFMTLVRSNSAQNGVSRKSNDGSPRKSFSALPASGTGSGTSTPLRRPILRSTQSEAVVSRGGAESELESEDGERGEKEEPVFDSSSKQRVQSYTDRILFRSNVGSGKVIVAEPSTEVVPSREGLPNLAELRTDSFTPRLDPLKFGTTQSYFDAKPKKPESPYSDAGVEPRHGRFDWFGRRHRRGLASRSTESLSLPGTTTPMQTSPKIQRSKSLHLMRRPSLARSLAPSESSDRCPKPFWRRRSSVASVPGTKALPTLPSPIADEAEDATPTALSPTSSRGSATRASPSIAGSPARIHTAETTPTSTLGRLPPFLGSPVDGTSPSEIPTAPISTTRRFSLFDGPISGSTSSTFFKSAPHFPRSLTRASQQRTSGVGTEKGSGRFKSLVMSFLPLPFLRHPSEEIVISSSTAADEEAERERVRMREARTGPRRGEIMVLAYDAVTDLARMGATSDHRPVFAVVAIGIEEED